MWVEENRRKREKRAEETRGRTTEEGEGARVQDGCRSAGPDNRSRSHYPCV